MKNKTHIFAAGLVVILGTIVIYLLAARSILQLPMCWLCLTALVLSEAAATCAFLLLDGSLKRIGIAVTLTAQTLYTCILSILFINLFLLSYARFLLYYIASIVLAAVICIGFSAFARSSKEKDYAFKQAKASMLTMRSAVHDMLNSDSGRTYGQLLRQLDENLRFSDDSSISEMDETISRRIYELSENISTPDYDVEGAIRSVNDLIKQRNFFVKSQKPFR